MKPTSIARWAGLVVGLSLAFVSLALARVPSGTGQVPAHVSLVAEPSVKLGVTPVGRELLSKRLLVAGGEPVSGVVEVANFTGEPLRLEPRLRSLHGELPEELHVDVTSGRRTLYRGKVDSLSAKLRLPARAKRPMRFRISAPGRAAKSVQGRVVELSLRWAARRAGS